jgi:hypothetical protein
VIELPHYFAKINRDPRYKFTAVGVPAVVAKQGLEKGMYERPELYGLSAEKGMNYHAEREVSHTLPDAPSQ